MTGQCDLDAGGWARLDVSDLPGSNGDTCAWCEEERAPGDYLVVADNRRFSICPTCWGRSAGYVELRQAGLAHEAALGRIGGNSGHPA